MNEILQALTAVGICWGIAIGVCLCVFIGLVITFIKEMSK